MNRIYNFVERFIIQKLFNMVPLEELTPLDVICCHTEDEIIRIHELAVSIGMKTNLNDYIDWFHSEGDLALMKDDEDENILCFDSIGWMVYENGMGSDWAEIGSLKFINSKKVY